jgi:recombination protein RecT
MLGVEPNGPLGEGYLVPYKNKGRYEAQLIIGYRGLINLARRSGMVSEIYAHCVYENDTFEIELGTDPHIKHRPALSDRGDMIGAYAVYSTTEGSKDFEYMSKEEIDRIRASSRAGNNGPWVQWYEEMARKTVIRRLSKRMPMSVEMAQAVEIDNKTSVGETVDHASAIDVTGIEIPEDAGPAAPADATAKLKEAIDG